MMKKLLIMLLIGLFLPFSAYAQDEPKDVPTDHWAYEAVMKCIEKKLLEGYPDRTFKGTRPITRYEMAMIIARLIDKLEELEGKIGVRDVDEPDVGVVEPKVDKVGAVTKKEFEEFKALVTKLSVEFKNELDALGVRVAALEEAQEALKKQLVGLQVGKVGISGEIRIRPLRAATEWGDITRRKAIDNAVDQSVKLSLTTPVTEDVTAKVMIWNRNWTPVAVALPEPLVSYEGWGEAVEKEKWNISEAYLTIKPTKIGGLIDKITVGRKYFQLGPIGLLCKSKYDRFGTDLLMVERNLNGMSFTGVGALLKDEDQYAAARLALKLGEAGELGVNVLARGVENAKNSFSADIKLDRLAAEVAQFKDMKDKEQDNAMAIAVEADLIKEEEMKLKVIFADIDSKARGGKGKGDDATFNPVASIIGWGDVPGVYRIGMRGVSVLGEYKMGDYTLSGEVCDGDEDSPIGFAKLTIGRDIAEGVKTSLSLIQVGEEEASRITIVRGELLVTF